MTDMQPWREPGPTLEERLVDAEFRFADAETRLVFAHAIARLACARAEIAQGVALTMERKLLEVQTELHEVRAHVDRLTPSRETFDDTEVIDLEWDVETSRIRRTA